MNSEKDRFNRLKSDGLPPHEWTHLPPLLGGNSNNSMLNACIGLQYDDLTALHACAQGYRQAAELILIRLEDQKDWMDTLVYPFAFNWRHYLN